MEKDLQSIRRLSKDSDESLFGELYKAGARFQPRADGGSDVFWPNGLDQLSGSQAVVAELTLSGLQRAAQDQAPSTVKPIEGISA